MDGSGLGGLEWWVWGIYFGVGVKDKVFYWQNGKEMKEGVCITVFPTVDGSLDIDKQNALYRLTSTENSKKQSLHPISPTSSTHIYFLVFLPTPILLLSTLHFHVLLLI